MNNPTDTNQASEDDLKQYLHEMHHRIMGDYDGDPYEEHPYQDESKSYFWEDEAKNLSELIRTEKLKLLAEVRERVVGEYETEYSNLDGDAGYWEKHGRNGMREKQIDALAKLEAEL
jgi:hypothetical protein